MAAKTSTSSRHFAPNVKHNGCQGEDPPSGPHYGEKNPGGRLHASSEDPKEGQFLSHRMSPGRKVAGNHRRCNIKSTIAKYRGCRSFLEKQ